MSDDFTRVLEKFNGFVKKDKNFDRACARAYNSLSGVMTNLNYAPDVKEFCKRFNGPILLFPYAEQHNGDRRGIGYIVDEKILKIYLSDSGVCTGDNFRDPFEKSARLSLSNLEAKIDFLNRITPEEIIKRLEEYQLEDN